MGFVVFVVSRLVLPPWVYNHLSRESATLIQQAELIAAVGVYASIYRTLPDLLEDEAAVHFVDNTGALSNLIHAPRLRLSPRLRPPRERVPPAARGPPLCGEPPSP